jgi:hypothetical protein
VVLNVRLCHRRALKSRVPILTILGSSSALLAVDGVVTRRGMLDATPPKEGVVFDFTNRVRVEGRTAGDEGGPECKWMRSLSKRSGIAPGLHLIRTHADC